MSFQQQEPESKRVRDAQQQIEQEAYRLEQEADWQRIEQEFQQNLRDAQHNLKSIQNLKLVLGVDKDFDAMSDEEKAQLALNIIKRSDIPKEQIASDTPKPQEKEEVPNKFMLKTGFMIISLCTIASIISIIALTFVFALGVWHDLIIVIILPLLLVFVASLIMMAAMLLPLLTFSIASFNILKAFGITLEELGLRKRTTEEKPKPIIDPRKEH